MDTLRIWALGWIIGAVIAGVILYLVQEVTR